MAIVGFSRAAKVAQAEDTCTTPAGMRTSQGSHMMAQGISQLQALVPTSSATDELRMKKRG